MTIKMIIQYDKNENKIIMEIDSIIKKIYLKKGSRNFFIKNYDLNLFR